MPTLRPAHRQAAQVQTVQLPYEGTSPEDDGGMRTVKKDKVINMTAALPQGSQRDWNDIEYSCSQVLGLCGAATLPDIFTLRFMHEYTTFLSFDTLLQMINKNSSDVTEIADLVALDTPDADSCIAAYSEFRTWRDFVTTACVYYLSENLN